MARRALFILLLIGLAQGSTHTLYAATRIKQGSLIRDAEIESALKAITEPLFQVAGLDPKDLKLYLIANDQINASATIDSTIFIHTGLITKAQSFEEVVGVLAHETGHIALGHMSRTMDAMHQASLLSMASMALGVIAAFAGAGPEALMGAIHAGHSMAMGYFTHYSRGQEASADQAALRFLKQLNWTNRGLLSFMKTLARQEYRSLERQSAYMRTHPLSSDRVTFLESSIKNIPKGRALPQDLEQKFHRIKLKIQAFLQPPQTILRTHSHAPYACAIAYYRDSQLDKSLATLAPLLQKFPKDPFLHELQGQIYFDLGYVHKATTSFKKAVTLLPTNPLLRLSYAQAALESGTIGLKALLKDIFFILNHDKKNPQAWHFLAVIYGKLNREDLAALALAEKELALANPDRALKQAKRATRLTSIQHVKLRATDIIQMVESANKDR